GCPRFCCCDLFERRPSLAARAAGGASGGRGHAQARALKAGFANPVRGRTPSEAEPRPGRASSPEPVQDFGRIFASRKFATSSSQRTGSTFHSFVWWALL